MTGEAKPPDDCPVCAGTLLLKQEDREVAVGKRRVRVRDEFYRCSDCSEELYAPGQMDATLMRASNKIREKEGLLLPSEIRAIRDERGLSQRALEELIGAGPKTVVRWEKGTVFQNATTDTLLRLIRDVPSVMRYLAARHGVALKTPHGLTKADDLRGSFAGADSPSEATVRVRDRNVVQSIVEMDFKEAA